MPDLTVYGSDCVVATHVQDCTGQVLPDAPFPICLFHAAKVLRYLNDAMPDAPSEALAAARTLEPAPPSAPLPVPGHEVGVVYYLRVGQHIKIGYSGNLVVRIRFYPPDTELLAYEHGDRKLELKRLRQFGIDRRMRLEWFAPSDKLLAHIKQVRAAMAA